MEEMNPERKARQNRAMEQYLAEQDAAKTGGSWRPATAPRPAAPAGPTVLAEGLIHSVTNMRIYSDGTFATKGGIFGSWSPPDRLIAFDFDMDSMRRKSVTGRGAAALMTGGLSLAASNNRGVLYVTVTGERTGVQTYTTRNPMGVVLTGTRSLKQAAEVTTAPSATTTAATSAAAPDSGIASQLQKLVDLHAAGALTDTEFAVAKQRLLS